MTEGLAQALTSSSGTSCVPTASGQLASASLCSASFLVKCTMLWEQRILEALKKGLEAEASICGPCARVVAHLVSTPWEEACAIFQPSITSS